MNPPFNLVLVHGDGSRVARLRLPRWIVYGTVGIVVAVFVAAAGLSGEYVRLRQQTSQLPALHQRVADQRALIDTFQKRVATVRSDVMAWTALHARMWEALGPEAGASEKGTGVGGAAPVAAAPAAAAGPRPLQELEQLAASVAEEGPRLRDLEDVVSRTGRILNALPLRWPVHGSVNSEFGVRQSPWSGSPEQHDGLDIGRPAGTPVKAPAPGKVIAARVGRDYGNHVTLDHGNGVRSLYGHLRKFDVKVGQQVEKGQVIGLVGSTGRSTGPHLHYEIQVDGKRVNPRRFLWEH